MRLGAPREFTVTVQSPANVTRPHGATSSLTQNRKQTHVKSNQTNVSELQRPRRPTQASRPPQTRQVLLLIVREALRSSAVLSRVRLWCVTIHNCLGAWF